jgi:hypothetical protein
MNMTLSKGAFGGAPNPRASYSAKPGRNGLYGKKPLANVNMAMGMSRLAIATNTVDFDRAIVKRFLSSKASFDRGIKDWPWVFNQPVQYWPMDWFMVTFVNESHDGGFQLGDASCGSRPRYLISDPN